MFSRYPHTTTRLLTTVATIGCIALPLLAMTQATGAQPRSWADALDAQVRADYSAPRHRAFDFWIGEWDVNWRSRVKDEFYHKKVGSWTRGRVFPILGGKALVEMAWSRDNPEQPSQRGFSIRYFNTEKERWVMAQHWPNPKGTGWAVLDQLIGGEHHGRLSVYSVTSQRLPDGSLRAEHRRYNFSDIRPGESFRWDGSNTSDFGVTWRTWTISEMHRLRDLDAFGEAGTAFPDVRNEHLCPEEPHGSLDLLEGVWEGTLTDQSGARQRSKLTAGKMLDGCAIAAVLEDQGRRTFMTFAYADIFGYWFNYRLDDQPGSAHTYYLSKAVGSGATFDHAPELAISDEFTQYVSKDILSELTPMSRSVYETISDNRLIWREESRQAPGRDWQTMRRYDLRRRQP